MMIRNKFFPMKTNKEKGQSNGYISNKSFFYIHFSKDKGVVEQENDVIIKSYPKGFNLDRYNNTYADYKNHAPFNKRGKKIYSSQNREKK